MTEPEILKTRASDLRKNMTRQERKLWYDFLAGQKPKWRRQVIFEPYIVDFYCPAAKLVVELDGGQHCETEAVQYDRKRTEVLERDYGLKVLRFQNTDIDARESLDAVCGIISAEAYKRAAGQG